MEMRKFEDSDLIRSARKEKLRKRGVVYVDWCSERRQCSHLFRSFLGLIPLRLREFTAADRLLGKQKT